MVGFFDFEDLLLMAFSSRGAVILALSFLRTLAYLAPNPDG